MHRLPGRPARDNGLSSHEGPAPDKSALCVPVLPRRAREAHSAVQTLFERPECNRRRDTPACLFPCGPAARPAPHRRVVPARPPPAARLRSKEPPRRGGGRGVGLGPPGRRQHRPPVCGLVSGLHEAAAEASPGPLDAGLISQGEGPSEPAPAPLALQPLGSQPGARHPRPAPLIPPPPRPPTPQGAIARHPPAQGHREHDLGAPSSSRNFLGLNESQLCSQRNQQNHRASKPPPHPHPAPSPPRGLRYEAHRAPRPREPALPPTAEQNTRPPCPQPHASHALGAPDPTDMTESLGPRRRDLPHPIL